MEYVAGVLIGVCFVMLYGYMALREKAAELELGSPLMMMSWRS